jgi:hypothetical protein
MSGLQAFYVGTVDTTIHSEISQHQFNGTSSTAPVPHYSEWRSASGRVNHRTT